MLACTMVMKDETEPLRVRLLLRALSSYSRGCASRASDMPLKLPGGVTARYIKTLCLQRVALPPATCNMLVTLMLDPLSRAPIEHLHLFHNNLQDAGARILGEALGPADASSSRERGHLGHDPDDMNLDESGESLGASSQEEDGRPANQDQAPSAQSPGLLLQSLSIIDNGVTSAGVEALVAPVMAHPCLRYLDLSLNSLDDSCAGCFRQLVSKNTVLEMLLLSETGAGAEVATQIGTALRRHAETTNIHMVVVGTKACPKLLRPVKVALQDSQKTEAFEKLCLGETSLDLDGTPIPGQEGSQAALKGTIESGRERLMHQYENMKQMRLHQTSNTRSNAIHKVVEAKVKSAQRERFQVQANKEIEKKKGVLQRRATALTQVAGRGYENDVKLIQKEIRKLDKLVVASTLEAENKQHLLEYVFRKTVPIPLDSTDLPRMPSDFKSDVGQLIKHGSPREQARLERVKYLEENPPFPPPGTATGFSFDRTRSNMNLTVSDSKVGLTSSASPDWHACLLHPRIPAKTKAFMNLEISRETPPRACANLMVGIALNKGQTPSERENGVAAHLRANAALLSLRDGRVFSAGRALTGTGTSVRLTKELTPGDTLQLLVDPTDWSVQVAINNCKCEDVLQLGAWHARLVAHLTPPNEGSVNDGTAEGLLPAGLAAGKALVPGRKELQGFARIPSGTSATSIEDAANDPEQESDQIPKPRLLHLRWSPENSPPHGNGGPATPRRAASPDTDSEDGGEDEGVAPLEEDLSVFCFAVDLGALGQTVSLLPPASRCSS